MEGNVPVVAPAQVQMTPASSSGFEGLSSIPHESSHVDYDLDTLDSVEEPKPTPSSSSAGGDTLAPIVPDGPVQVDEQPRQEASEPKPKGRKRINRSNPPIPPGHNITHTPFHPDCDVCRQCKGMKARAPRSVNRARYDDQPEKIEITYFGNKL